LARDRVPMGQTSTSRFLVNRRQFQVKAIRLAQTLRCLVVYSREDYALEYVRCNGRWWNRIKSRMEQTDCWRHEKDAGMAVKRAGSGYT
jgi:hypothetical protein